MQGIAKFLTKKLALKVFGVVGVSGLLYTLGLVLLAAIMASAISGDEQMKSYVGSAYNLPPEVEAHRAMMVKYCEQYDMESYVDILLAIMAVETGGKGSDPMNASLSGFNRKYPQKPGGIKSVAYSIEVGVLTFRVMQDESSLLLPGDTERLKLAVQGYNFGVDYIPWARDKDAGYTPENAKEYSNKKAAELGLAQYGNPNYVNLVMQYYRAFGEDGNFNMGGSATGSGMFLWPVPSCKTLSRGYGIMSDGEFHRGLDVNGPGVNGSLIVAADSGVVVVSVKNHWSYGNYVVIDHGNGYRTLYAHCSSILTSQGTIVSRGDVIATVGNTGNSTGPHLHFEVSLNGSLIDPASVL